MMKEKDGFWFSVVVVLILGTLVSLGGGVFAASAPQFVARDIVRLRFDQDTEKALAALESAVVDAQAALDPDKKTLDILATIEAAILDRTEDEKVELVKRAQAALVEAGVPAESAEAKAINLKVFGTDTIPEPVPVEPVPVSEQPAGEVMIR